VVVGESLPSMHSAEAGGKRPADGARGLRAAGREQPFGQPKASGGPSRRPAANGLAGVAVACPTARRRNARVGPLPALGPGGSPALAAIIRSQPQLRCFRRLMEIPDHSADAAMGLRCVVKMVE
jgi:hypothetical protein